MFMRIHWPVFVSDKWTKHNSIKISTSELKCSISIITGEDAKKYYPLLLDRGLKRRNGISARRNSFGDATHKSKLGGENAMTFEDVQRLRDGLPLERYSAFIVCSDGERDRKFADKIQLNLKEFNLKVSSKLLLLKQMPHFRGIIFYFAYVQVIDKRNLLPGLFENVAIMKIIEERCDRLIVVLSREFSSHLSAEFYAKYAQWIGISENERKIIPCKYENFKPPSNLAIYCALYHEPDVSYDKIFWSNLELSLISVRKQM